MQQKVAAQWYSAGMSNVAEVDVGQNAYRISRNGAFWTFLAPLAQGAPPWARGWGPPPEYLRLANGRCMLPWDGCCLPKDA